MSKLTLSAALVATLVATTVGPAQAEFQDRTIRASLTLPKEHSQGVGLTNFVTCVGEKTGGKLVVEPYFNGVLGGDIPALQQLRSGSLEMVVAATASLTPILPAAGAFDLPFLFRDEAEAQTVLDGKPGELLTAGMETVGLVNLAFWEYGFRQTTNAKHPINTAADFADLKMRVMPNPVIVEAFKALGGVPLTTSMSELYTALETGAVDGQENPPSTAVVQKFYEVQKYLSMTRHMYNPSTLVYSKALFDQLTPEEQAVLTQCGSEGRAEQIRFNMEQNVKSLDVLRENGMEINEVPAEEIAKMREAVQPIYESQTSAVGPEMMDAVMGELKRLRGE